MGSCTASVRILLVSVWASMNEHGGPGYDSNVLYLLSYILLMFFSVTQNLGVVRPAGNGEEENILFLHWSEVNVSEDVKQIRFRDKQSNLNMEWHSGSKFPVSHLKT